MRIVSSFVNGESKSPTDGRIRPIGSPYDGATVAEAQMADARLLEEAIASANEMRESVRRLPPHVRADILEQLAHQVHSEKESFAQMLCEEAGKPMKLSRVEADRCVETIRDAAHWCRQMQDEFLPLDGSPVGVNRQGILKRFPVGLVAAIAPFNFPLNLVAHKIAPAIAAGCPVVLKPASQTPSPAVRLAQLANEAGWPAGALNVVLLAGADAAPLVTDERPAMITFTGSPDVGWDIKKRCGRKKVALELGGNAAAIVEPDADWQTAVGRLTGGAFAYAGQSCISVQRIYVHESISNDFIPALVEAARGIVTGDPQADDTVCGPLIDRPNAERVEQWIADAESRGARVLCGNERNGNVITPTLVAGVPADLPLSCQEVFGPVATVDTYVDFEDTLRRVNDSRFGLQAGIYTNNWRRIWRAFEVLEVGGVIHNDAPTFRVDKMPYGGAKLSGMGREGARWAIREMTEPRLLLLSTA
jgi:acyl-CoA reductase-like NAD-dependent aldehyde dehydrogenase